MSLPAEQRLREAAARVRAEAAARYPHIVDTTSWSLLDGRPVVAGWVLVASQAAAYQRALAEFALEGGVPRATVLTDLDTEWQRQRWHRLGGDEPVDLHRDADRDDLQTQWQGPAVVRRFADAREPARTLIQLPDGTVGWVASDRVEPEPLEPERDPWGGIHRPSAGRAVQPGPSAAPAPLERAAQLGRGRLGRPYRWGGNTDAAADCSGFVQSIARGAADVLLPKNTADQLALGERVPRDGIGAGHFVFVRGRDKRLRHVGLAVAGSDGTTVLHSCLSRGRVLEESLPDFLDRYVFLGARRIVSWESSRS